MRIPVRPPEIDGLIREAIGHGPGQPAFDAIFGGAVGPAPGGKYRHWDNLRHLEAPRGLTPEQLWAAVKLARRQLYRRTPILDVRGQPFQFGLPPVALQLLHHVDRGASGVIGAPDQVTNPQTQATYLLKSIVEEAIKSSQLEGASTTRRVAKDMLLSGREPRDRSERMILNNYRALQYVRQHKAEPPSPSRILELQAILTEGTLDEPDAAGRFRRADEPIVVEDETGTILHHPPAASELPDRLATLCDFANGGGTGEFMHPVVRAILVHFGLAYDHPFVDGNGRTARALFYWVMAREGYWLCEYVSISRILRKARAQYARSFLYTETDDNDATYFILYQLEVLTRAIADLHSYLERKAGEIREADDLVRRSRTLYAELNARQLDLLTHALKHPQGHYTIDSHRRAHDVAYATARSDLFALAERGLLEQRKRGRAFVFLAPTDLRARLSVAPDAPGRAP
jgi:Fic family protein